MLYAADRKTEPNRRKYRQHKGLAEWRNGRRWGLKIPYRPILTPDSISQMAFFKWFRGSQYASVGNRSNQPLLVLYKSCPARSRMILTDGNWVTDDLSSFHPSVPRSSFRAPHVASNRVGGLSTRSPPILCQTAGAGQLILCPTGQPRFFFLRNPLTDYTVVV